MSLHLYEIADEMERLLFECVDPETGEIVDDDAAAKLNAWEATAEEKALAVAAVVKQTRCEAEAVKGTAKGLIERAKKLERQADWLENYLAEHADAGAYKGKRLADGRVEINWRKTTRTIVERPDLVPAEFRLAPKPVQAPPPSADKLKAAMQRRNTHELKADDGTVYARLDVDSRIGIK